MVIGINPWVAHREEATFGGNVEAWTPNQWLCEEAKRKKMEYGLLPVCCWNAVVSRQTLTRGAPTRDIGLAFEKRIAFGDIQAGSYNVAIV